MGSSMLTAHLSPSPTKLGWSPQSMRGTCSSLCSSCLASCTRPLLMSGCGAGLLCLKQAKRGGLSSFTSSISIVNEMVRLGR